MTGLGGVTAAAARERGIALVIVLWGLVLLAAVAVSFATGSRTETKLARNLLDNAKARALADAGVQRAVLALLGAEQEPVFGREIETVLSGRPALREALIDRPEVQAMLMDRGQAKAAVTGGEETERFWRADGTSYAWPFGDGIAIVSVQDEGGKIDLNRAPDDLLRGLFRSVGLDEDKANALVDAIADFGDADDLRRLNGAEDDDYRAAGLPHGAKDRPFEAVEELERVFGMTPRLYRAVASFLTVHSARGKIDLMAAPREVLLAVPGVDPSEVEALLAARAAIERPIGRKPLPLLTGARGYFSLSGRRVFTVRSEAHTESGAVFVREAVVRLTRDPEQPFRFLAWKQGERAPTGDNEEN